MRIAVSQSTFIQRQVDLTQLKLHQVSYWLLSKHTYNVELILNSHWVSLMMFHQRWFNIVSTFCIHLAWIRKWTSTCDLQGRQKRLERHNETPGNSDVRQQKIFTLSTPHTCSTYVACHGYKIGKAYFLPPNQLFIAALKLNIISISPVPKVCLYAWERGGNLWKLLLEKGEVHSHTSTAPITVRLMWSGAHFFFGNVSYKKALPTLYDRSQQILWN